MGKSAKDKRDIYYRLAKQNGYRSRSAYKLLQIDSFFNIFSNEELNYIVDLCGAPGGWSQVSAVRSNSNSSLEKVIAVDLQEMAPIDGVVCIHGDITSQDTINQIMKLTNSKQIDLVLCDGAPDITGFNEFDVFVQKQLILFALNIAIRLLADQGKFVCKIFKGKHTNSILQIISNFFAKITIAKPKACRNASFESFLVCEGFKKSEFLLNNSLSDKIQREDIIYLNSLYDDENDKTLNDLNIELVQVGTEEYDSDKTYDLETTNYTELLKAVQAPINPPYKKYIDSIKGATINTNK